MLKDPFLNYVVSLFFCVTPKLFDFIFPPSIKPGITTKIIIANKHILPEIGESTFKPSSIDESIIFDIADRNSYVIRELPPSFDINISIDIFFN